MSLLQSNYLVFMAELFWWFEVVKPSFVQPRVFDLHGKDLGSPKLTTMETDDDDDVDDN